jgi:Helix-hairpin-helix domain
MNLVRLSISVVHGPAAAVPSEISRALAPNINVMVFMTSSSSSTLRKSEASNSDISIPTWETKQRSVDREDSEAALRPDRSLGIVVSALGAMRTAMPDLDASAVAKLLGEFGQRSALRGGNPYRARAYRRAAENLLALTTPI